MVSIDEAISIEKTIKESPKAYALRSFLEEEEIVIPQTELNERDIIYYSILQALAKNQNSNFSNHFDEICKRKVVEDQPIVYDNFLLFVLIVGAIKFKTSKDWLRNVLSLRKTQNEPERSITYSFQNLLDNNILTTNGIPSVVMAGLIKAGKEDFDVLLLKNSFDVNARMSVHVGKDLFLASILLYTNNYVISLSIDKSSFRLKKFEITFLKRVNVLQNIIYVIIFAFLTALWFFAINRFPQIKQVANDLGMLLQLIGIGILAFSLNKIKDQFGNWIKSFFGYKE